MNISMDKFDAGVLNQKLQEIDNETLEDHTHENTPEESDE